MYVIQCAFSRDRKIFLPWPRCLFRIISLVHLLSLSLSLSPPPSFPTKSAFHVAYRECRIFFNTCDRDNISDVFLFRLVFLPGTYLSPKIKKKRKKFQDREQNVIDRSGSIGLCISVSCITRVASTRDGTEWTSVAFDTLKRVSSVRIICRRARIVYLN